jgi:hypothetical protein
MAKRFVQYFGGFLRLRLEETADATRKVNKALSTAATDFHERVREMARDLSEEERTEVYNESADEDMSFSIAEQFARRAMLIAAYANFEDSLKRLCKHAVKLNLSKRRVPGKGFHIKEARAFLSEIRVGENQFAVAAFGTSWSEIDQGWRPLRNNLVHEYGVVEFDRGVEVLVDDSPTWQTTRPIEEAEDAAQIKSFIQGRSDLKLEFGELVLGEGIVDSFLKVAAKATADIIQELERVAPPSPPEPPQRAR